MTFGLNYVTFAYNPDRMNIVARSLTSLSKTITEGLGKPVLRISYKPSEFIYEKYVPSFLEKFEVSLHPDPSHYPSSMTYAVQDSALRLVYEHPEVTHIVHLCDDRIWNPMWLVELSKLVERHPGAKAWSIYRSRYTAFHRITGGDGTDVTMTMFDALGCTTREDWINFVTYHGYVTCPDIDYAGINGGEYWATNRDYSENICRHAEIAEEDCAIDWVGEDYNG